MKKTIRILPVVLFVILISYKLFSQADPVNQELGITVGGLTNFPANSNNLKDDINMLYVAPYVRVGQHEFSAGVVYPLTAHALYFNENNNTISPRPGAIARYKFYLWNAAFRENLFVHYSFQYLRFKGDYDVTYLGSPQPPRWTEKDMYINNVIGIGYNVFFDTDARFGLYYTLDYVISQRGFHTGPPDNTGDTWVTSYVWNNLSTHIGFSFKLTSLNKKNK
jgi:hypothetical protein